MILQLPICTLQSMILFSQIRIVLLICCEIVIVAKYNTPSLQLRPQFQIEGSGRHFMGQSQFYADG